MKRERSERYLKTTPSCWTEFLHKKLSIRNLDGMGVYYKDLVFLAVAIQGLSAATGVGQATKVVCARDQRTKTFHLSRCKPIYEQDYSRIEWCGDVRLQRCKTMSHDEDEGVCGPLPPTV